MVNFPNDAKKIIVSIKCNMCLQNVKLLTFDVPDTINKSLGISCPICFTQFKFTVVKNETNCYIEIRGINDSDIVIDIE
jgi:hypothetical protein